MIRFPLELPPVAKRKHEGWRSVLVGFAAMLFCLLAWILVLWLAARY